MTIGSEVVTLVIAIIFLSLSLALGSATKTIFLPSGDHSKSLMFAFSLVICLFTKFLVLIVHIC